jgi:hypothetical protein
VFISRSALKGWNQTVVCMTEVLHNAPRDVSSSALPYKFEDNNDSRVAHVKHKVYCYVTYKTTDIVFRVSSVN